MGTAAPAQHGRMEQPISLSSKYTTGDILSDAVLHTDSESGTIML